MVTPNTFPLIVDLPLTDSQKMEGRSELIGVCEAKDSEFILSQAISEGIDHIVQKDSIAFDQEMALATLMIRDPQSFFNYPLSSILDPTRASSERELELCKVRVKCSSRTERHEAVATVLKTVEGQINDRLLADLRVIATELITNATIHGTIKDDLSDVTAVTDLKKLAADNGKSPDAPMLPCFLGLGWDDERLIIMCRDLYGTLKSRELLERIRRAIAFGTSLSINYGEGGAGIGTHMVFDLSISMYIAVAQGQTMICTALPMRGGWKRRENLTKNLHLYCAADANVLEEAK